jgi:hypothetical protein
MMLSTGLFFLAAVQFVTVNRIIQNTNQYPRLANRLFRDKDKRGLCLQKSSKRVMRAIRCTAMIPAVIFI